MNSHDRVLIKMNQGKEPKGHCEAVRNRDKSNLGAFNKAIKKELKAKT